jgi:methionyl-tRNA formyltransferase
MRLVFMGSSVFGVPSLEALLAAGHEIALVMSQPDRPAGRGRRLRAPAVAEVARGNGLPLYQPESLRGAAALEPIRSAAPAVAVVAAYGLILPRALLDLPEHGCVNVHPSLLPRHRGASPVQAAILDGDQESGVTIIELTEQMDAGPVIAQARTAIQPTEDAPSLEARLADLGAQLLVDSLGPWASGKLVAEPQDETAATYCPRLTRADAELHWSHSAIELTRRVRALRGRSDAYTYWGNRLLKIVAAEEVATQDPALTPGVVFVAQRSNRPRRPIVQAGTGALELREVALEGRSPTTGEQFLHGYPGLVGDRLGRFNSQD